MQITVKLFASFRVGRFAATSMEYPPGTAIREVVRALQIPEEQLGIIMVNNRHAGLEQQLQEGDSLALFPLLGGG